MKEIKEEKTREVKETFTYYEAPDGTRFTDPEECSKYETSAKGVMREKVKPLMSEPKNAWEVMGGYDDNLVVAVSLPEESTVDTILQWFFLEFPWYLEDHQKEKREEVVKTITEAYIKNDVLLFALNCEDEYYFINSRQNIINNLLNLTKKEKKDE